MKIIIAGVGGVGGYFGGLLAHYFFENALVQINFIARGEHLRAIQKNGLRVICKNKIIIARPVIATSDPSEIGIVDFIVICTKTYDLEKIIELIKPCVSDDTIILPLLNGVDSRERIKRILPHNIVLDGCAYIVSRLKYPGVVENKGNIQTIYFGLNYLTNNQLVFLEKIFKEASIEVSLTADIERVIWEKYIFISSVATATAFFNKSFGELLLDKECLKLLSELVKEVKNVAIVKRIAITEDFNNKIIDKLKSLPFDATSSMHSDFIMEKSKNELDSLTGYVVFEGYKNNIPTPTYETVYRKLKQGNI